MDDNSSDSNIQDDSLYFYSIFDAVIITESFLAFMLNTVTIFVIWKYLWTRSNQLVLCLAISNAFTGILIPTLILLIVFRQMGRKYEWDVTCKVHFSLTSIPVCINCLTLTAIAIQRFYVVYFPLKAKVNITIRRMQAVGVLIWIPVILGLPFALYFGENKDKPLHLLWICSPGYVLELNRYFFGAVIIPFILCSMLIFFCYSMVGIYLCRRQTSKICEQADKSLGVLQSRKTTLILCASTISFYVLYIPAVIVHFVDVEKVVLNLITCLLHISFLINPFLYAL